MKSGSLAGSVLKTLNIGGVVINILSLYVSLMQMNGVINNKMKVRITVIYK
jgi:hypothetical protein